MEDLLIGCDPELFLSRKGKYISAHDLVMGSKEKPYAVTKGAVQPDGLAAEFNIMPAATSGQYIKNINTVMQRLKQMLPSDVEMVLKSWVHFDQAYMDKLPEKVKELGCNPDFNAYEEGVNMAPEQHPTMRTAAGHIHLGWTENRDPMDPQHFLSCCILIKNLDVFLGVPSVLMDKEGGERRKMYGKAGCFRPKSYGCEYRSLSNFWLKDTEHMR